jgi:hypothetical protein
MSNTGDTSHKALFEENPTKLYKRKAPKNNQKRKRNNEQGPKSRQAKEPQKS